jgi:hypothetical protein
MTVFANGLEVSCKAQANKVIAAFPYVAFTPPQTPATPPGVPVPYPTFGLDSDTDKGTGTVKIGGKTINQKNKSYYTKCSGDEAGCAPKKNIITSKNTGKTYAHAWSNDVKADGEPVQRFSDIASNDHTSPQGGGPPFPKVAKLNFGMAGDADCLVGSYEATKDNCNARKDKNDPTAKPGTPGVAYQAHHIVPDRCYRVNSAGDRMKDPPFPSRNAGICICLPRTSHSAARPATGEDVTVHHFLDDNLTAIGQKGKPSGVAKVSDIRLECLQALAMLVDDPVSADCFNLAADEVVKQTNPIKDNSARAEKSAKNLSGAATKVLKAQK